MPRPLPIAMNKTDKKLPEITRDEVDKSRFLILTAKTKRESDLITKTQFPQKPIAAQKHQGQKPQWPTHVSNRSHRSKSREKIATHTHIYGFVCTFPLPYLVETRDSGFKLRELLTVSRAKSSSRRHG